MAAQMPPFTTKNYHQKNSPDCSGYAIVPRGHFEARAIAFERKAGRPFVKSNTVSLRKK